MITAKELGLYISERRREKGLTQKDLAQRLYVTDKAVSRWERGKGFPDIVVIKPLAEALDVSINELLGEKTEETESVTEKKTAAVNSIQAIIDSFEKERVVFQKRSRIKKTIIIIIFVLLAAGCLCYFCPFPTRVNQTLYGYREIEETKETVVIEIDGWLLHYLFKDTYIVGDIRCFHGEKKKLLFERWFSGHDIYGMSRFSGITGKLEEKDELYLYYGMLVRMTKEETKTDSFLSYVTDKKFSKILLENGFFPGRIVAASDPDVDLERVRERFSGELK